MRHASKHDQLLRRQQSNSGSWGRPQGHPLIKDDRTPGPSGNFVTAMAHGRRYERVRGLATVTVIGLTAIMVVADVSAGRVDDSRT
jgi:hypothetical protein